MIDILYLNLTIFAFIFWKRSKLFVGFDNVFDDRIPSFDSESEYSFTRIIVARLLIRIARKMIIYVYLRLESVHST